jgi:hypothetical protein
MKLFGKVFPLMVLSLYIISVLIGDNKQKASIAYVMIVTFGLGMLFHWALKSKS